MEFLSKSLEETKKVAHDFVSKLEARKESATVVGLYGELGSGKTTFMKYLAEALGVRETIKSPTFVIMRKHELRDSRNEKRNKTDSPYLVPRTSYFEYLIHIDAYRIEKDEEMLHLGWEEMIKDHKNLICIEWAEKIEKLLPPHIVITFEHAGETERKISIA